MCSVCSKGFIEKRSCQEHELIHLPKEEREKVICPVCHEEKLNKATLRVHMLLHTSEWGGGGGEGEREGPGEREEKPGGWKRQGVDEGRG